MRLTASLPKALAKKLRVKAAVARATVSGTGQVTVTLRLPAAVARKLAKQKRVTFTLAGTGSYAGGASVPLRTSLSLRR